MLAGLSGPKKFKMPNLAISSIRKGEMLKNEKRTNKCQIFKENLLRQEKHIQEFCRILQVLLRFLQNRVEMYHFVELSEKAKQFYFWKTGSKKANFGLVDLLKGQMATLCV